MWIEYDGYSVDVTNINRATDYWSSDSEEYEELDKETAVKLITFLQEKYNL